MSTVCPVSERRVEAITVRLTAALVIGILAVGLASDLLSWVAVALAVDFFIRAFTNRPVSPISYFARQMRKQISKPAQLTNAAPKVFAAKLGFLMTVVIAITGFFGLQTIASSLAFMLIILAGLEAVFSYCLGCQIYSLLLKLQKKQA